MHDIREYLTLTFGSREKQAREREDGGKGGKGYILNKSKSGTSNSNHKPYQNTPEQGPVDRGEGLKGPNRQRLLG